jgi:hypothetical protein
MTSQRTAARRARRPCATAARDTAGDCVPRGFRAQAATARRVAVRRLVTPLHGHAPRLVTVTRRARSRQACSVAPGTESPAVSAPPPGVVHPRRWRRCDGGSCRALQGAVGAAVYAVGAAVYAVEAAVYAVEAAVYAVEAAVYAVGAAVYAVGAAVYAHFSFTAGADATEPVAGAAGGGESGAAGGGGGDGGAGRARGVVEAGGSGALEGEEGGGSSAAAVRGVVERWARDHVVRLGLCPFAPPVVDSGRSVSSDQLCVCYVTSYVSAT